jgi:hypothetical protein
MYFFTASIALASNLGQEEARSAGPGAHIENSLALQRDRQGSEHINEASDE